MLTAAVAAIERGDDAAALVALLEAWRAVPDPALAELVEQLAARVIGPPLAGKTLAARDAEFRRRCDARDPADLAVLLDHALARRQSPNEPARWVAALRFWPRDPRTTRPLLAALASPAWDSAAANGLWDSIFELLAHTADPRAFAAVAELDFAKIWARRRFDQPHTAAIRAMTRRRDNLLDARAATPATTPAQAAAIAAFAGRLRPPRSHGALIDAVLEHPDRAEARDVLRDALLELGDPRGEHMAIDAVTRTRALTPVEQRRRIELQHGARWWPELDEIVMLPVARDGFLAQCSLSADRAHLLDAAVGHPLWSTVERIDLQSWNLPLPVALFAHPVMRSLAALGGLRHETAPAIWNPSTTWLRTIDLQHLTPSWSALLNQGDAPPNLRRLETAQYYDRVDDYAWLWTTSVFRRVRELAVHLGNSDLGRWQAAVSGASHAHLARIDLGRFRLERDARDRLARLTVTLPATPRETPHTKTIAAALGLLAARSITEVDFVGRAIDRKQRAVLEAGLDRQAIARFTAELA